MPDSSVVFNSVKLNYYILSIDPSVTFDLINKNIESFKSSPDEKLNIGVELLDKPSDEKQWISDFIDNLKSHNLTITFFKKNKIISTSSYHNLPVLELSTNFNQKKIKSTITINEPIRGGSLVNNSSGDVVVVSDISYGAEVEASGNVYIYGKCEGSVIAGKDGDKKARIFITNFLASKIGIGNKFVVITEELSQLKNKSVQVYLNDLDKVSVALL